MSKFGISRGRLLPRHRSSAPRRLPRHAPANAAGQPRAGPRRHGAGCRPDPGNGDGTLPAPLRTPNGPAGRKRSVFSTRSLRSLREGEHPTPRRADPAQLRRSDPDHHSVGRQPLHREPDRTGPRRIRPGVLGLLDARRHGWRRDGLPVRPGHTTPRANSALRRSCPPRAADWRGAFRSPWSRWFTTSRINENGSIAELREGADALPPAYYTLRVPSLLRQEQRSLSRAQRAELERFGDACRHEPALRGMVDLLDHLLPQSQEEAGAAPRNLRALLDDLGFDSRPSREDTRRTPRGPHRPFPEPPARLEPHRRCPPG
jgi:hypothetical protein